LNIVMPGNTVTGQSSRIMGEANANANDGTIARFGWKAQNKSLLLFTGEAYNVEMGITNELFQTEREEGCQLFMTPNDFTDPTQKGVDVLSDIEKFYAFAGSPSAFDNRARRRSIDFERKDFVYDSRLLLLPHALAED
jgi:CxxC motif-containing protein (DUF1111 family)